MNSQPESPKLSYSSLTESEAERTECVNEYLQGTLKHLLQLEALCPPRSDYMQLQQEVSTEMRSSLLAWMVKVHFAFQLCPQTLFLAVRLTDRVLSLEMVQGEELLLLGLACLLIASKMEDKRPLYPTNLVACVSDYCTIKNIVAAERNVMRLIDYSPSRIVHSLSFYELMTHSLPPSHTHSDCNFLARYFLELQTFELTASQDWRPSLQAAAALSLAFDHTDADNSWSPPQEFRVSHEELIACRTHLEHNYVSAMETKNHAIRLKFSSSAFQGVSSQAV